MAKIKKIKMKTKKAVAKRVKVSGTGKLKIKNANRSHRFIGKSTKNKRAARSGSYVHKSDMYRWRQMLQGK